MYPLQWPPKAKKGRQEGWLLLKRGRGRRKRGTSEIGFVVVWCGRGENPGLGIIRALLPYKCIIKDNKYIKSYFPLHTLCMILRENVFHPVQHDSGWTIIDDSSFPLPRSTLDCGYNPLPRNANHIESSETLEPTAQE